jgi:hypothetical protein
MSAAAEPQPTTPAAGERLPDQRGGPAAGALQPEAVPEIGGPSGPEPTRYGDWEKGGRCSDF